LTSVTWQIAGSISSTSHDTQQEARQKKGQQDLAASASEVDRGGFGFDLPRFGFDFFGRSRSGGIFLIQQVAPQYPLSKKSHRSYFLLTGQR
jgi:hypothetical protein